MHPMGFFSCAPCPPQFPMWATHAVCVSAVFLVAPCHAQCHKSVAAEERPTPVVVTVQGGVFFEGSLVV